MQYFEWYLKPEDKLWQKVSQEAKELKKVGITDVWLPPAYKGAGGKYDAGYAVYDLYDLGEFNQKGSIETKYGTKDEYLQAIMDLHENDIKVYADIVLNHKIGADEAENVYASEEEYQNRNVDTTLPTKIKAWTIYNFPMRNNKYSDFKWNYKHFNGTDWDESGRKNGIFRFSGKHWDKSVDEENGNYDYLMGADIDFNNSEVVEELNKWGKWYLDFTRVDNFRLDAVKHIKSGFMADWIRNMKESRPNLQCVGEYWNRNIDVLKSYINNTDSTIPLFDVPLHYNFFNASNDPNYNMSQILEHTLVKENPCKAVTFVDNHDTQPGQALQSFIQSWFKSIAYSIILLRNDGYPCVFYGDYYGIEHDHIEPVEDLKTLMLIRKNRSYGLQHDYFDHNNFVGWTQEGDNEHINSGLAVVISNAGDGYKRMYVGNKNVGEKYIDCLGNCEEEVTIDEDGCGNFSVKSRSVSVWIKK